MTLFFVEEIHDSDRWFSLGAWYSFSSFFVIRNVMRVDCYGFEWFCRLDGAADSCW